MEKKQVAVLLAKGFEEIEALVTVNLLRRAGIEVFLVGVSSQVVEGGQGTPIVTEKGVTDSSLRRCDAIVLPGGGEGVKQLAASPEVRTLLVGMAREKHLIAAICAAPAVVLAEVGLLEGKRFTCYPSFAPSKNNAASGIYVEKSVVVDGLLITSRGPGTSHEFAFAIISFLLGDQVVTRVKEQTLF